jgi:hypothetical protein
MKNTFLILSFILMYHLTDAQTLTMDRVPKDAAHAFRTKYPAAQQETWQRTGENIFQVGFFNAKKAQIQVNGWRQRLISLMARSRDPSIRAS